MSEKRALVAGGAGFLGSHLCERLLADGYSVVALDNLQTGSEDNLVSFRDRSGFEFRRQNVIDPIEGEFDEIGTWIDFRTDCLGFRFSVSYENDFTCVDGSRYDHDWNFGFFVYLRALGPSSGNPLHGD